jgi:hypothetical protein
MFGGAWRCGDRSWSFARAKMGLSKFSAVYRRRTIHGRKWRSSKSVCRIDFSKVILIATSRPCECLPAVSHVAKLPDTETARLSSGDSDGEPLGPRRHYQHRNAKAVEHRGDRLSQGEVGEKPMAVGAENQKVQALLVRDAHQLFRGIAIAEHPLCS